LYFHSFSLHTPHSLLFGTSASANELSRVSCCFETSWPTVVFVELSAPFGTISVSGVSIAGSASFFALSSFAVLEIDMLLKKEFESLCYQNIRALPIGNDAQVITKAFFNFAISTAKQLQHTSCSTNPNNGI
jgi:hypothetical protein